MARQTSALSSLAYMENWDDSFHIITFLSFQMQWVKEHMGPFLFLFFSSEFKWISTWENISRHYYNTGIAVTNALFLALHSPQNRFFPLPFFSLKNLIIISKGMKNLKEILMGGTQDSCITFMKAYRGLQQSAITLKVFIPAKPFKESILRKQLK